MGAGRRPDGLPGDLRKYHRGLSPGVSRRILAGVGKAFVLSQPAFAPGEIPVEIVPTHWIRLPHLVFDLLLGFLLYRVVVFGGLWGPRRQGPGWGRLAALAYWWNPAVLFGSAWWGQFDSMHAFLAVASIAALGGDRWILSAAALSAAGLLEATGCAVGSDPRRCCGPSARSPGGGDGGRVGSFRGDPFVRAFLVDREEVRRRSSVSWAMPTSCPLHR